MPQDAPRWGVICVAQASRDHGRVIWHGGDYYWWEHGEWLRSDLVGLIDYLTRPGTEKIVVIGRTVPPAHFHRIFQMAVNDPRLPPKTSREHLERQIVSLAPQPDELPS